MAAVYWPGMHGDYVFDDIANLIENPSIKITALDWPTIVSTVLSGAAGPFGRPISVISFALNYFWTGIDPFYFKLTNLLIHLGNVLVLGQVARLLIAQLSTENDPAKKARRAAWGGWLVAALWGLHPLNLTGVLYVVQRMTSLCTLFGMLALWVYVAWRVNTIAAGGRRDAKATGAAAIGVVLLLAASVFTKESGLLFVLLLLWIEYSVFGFRRAGGEPVRLGKVKLQTALLWMLVVGGGLVAVLVLPRMLAPSAFVNRDFNATERLLTEARVLFLYLRLLVLPRNEDLSLYHDDVVISHGLWDPPSTALACLALIAISAFVVYCRKRVPVLLFAWGWFLISHALESTFFSLDLVYEHRNYFAVMGFFIALPVLLERWRLGARDAAWVVLPLYALVLGAITWNRSEQWANNVDLAVMEATNRPLSARANYNLGRVYLRLFDSTGEARFLQLANAALLKSADSYNSGVGPYFALLHGAYFANETPDPAIIEKLKEGLRTQPFYNANVAFIQAFSECQIKQQCHMPDVQAIELMVVALENPRTPAYGKAEVDKLLAQYFINRFGDLDKGIEFIGDAVAANDSVPTRIMYAQAFRLKGDKARAAQEIERAARMDRFGAESESIEREREAQKKAAAPQP